MAAIALRRTIAVNKSISIVIRAAERRNERGGSSWSLFPTGGASAGA